MNEYMNPRQPSSLRCLVTAQQQDLWILVFTLPDRALLPVTPRRCLPHLLNPTFLWQLLLTRHPGLLRAPRVLLPPPPAHLFNFSPSAELQLSLTYQLKFQGQRGWLGQPIPNLDRGLRSLTVVWVFQACWFDQPWPRAQSMAAKTKSTVLSCSSNTWSPKCVNGLLTRAWGPGWRIYLLERHWRLLRRAELIDQIYGFRR